MAGGFFSGGSSDSVNASVAEAEAAAARAEAAAAEISALTEFDGQTDEGNYTVPNADDAEITKFLNQEGNWLVPANTGGVTDLDGLSDVTITSPTDTQILQYNGSVWENVTAAAGSNLTAGEGLEIVSDVISVSDLGISTAKLAADSVTTAKIPNDAVTTAKIPDNAIVSNKIEASAVTSVKIAADAVTNAKLADGSVDSEQIVENAVGRVELDTTNAGTDGQILSRAGDRLTWINDDASLTAGTGIDITNEVVSIADNGVTTDKIADGDITEAKLDITNVGTAGQILTNAGTQFTWVDADGNTVYTASEGLTLVGDDFQIADDGVTTVKINDGSVTSAKILNNNVTADELNVTGDGTSGQILSSDGDGSFTWIDEGADTAYTGSDGITLTGTDFTLTDNGVGADKLNVSDNGTTGQILSSDGDGSFSWIDDTSGTTYTAGTGLDLSDSNEFSIANDGVDTAQIADNAVVTNSINNLAVTSGKIANGAVGTTQIADDAVNESKLNVLTQGVTGQVLSSNGSGTFTWSTPAAGTNFTASDGITLASDDFSLTDSGVTTAKINDGAVTGVKIADNAVTATQLNVASNGSDGQYLVSGGTGQPFDWVDAVAGSLADLTDTNIPASISDRRLLEFEPSDGTWNATSISDILRISDMFDVHEDTPSDGQFLRYDADNADGPGWVNTTVTIPGAVAAGTGISVSGSTVSVTPNGITNALLANNSVRTENISDGTITGTDMADGTVGNTQIADDAVTAAKIADNTITAAQVASNSLGATELATDSVSSFKLQDDAVISGKIANNVVGADELDVSGDGTSGQFLTSDGDGTFSWTTSSGGVTYTAGQGLDLSDTNVFSIPDDGITNGLIADDAVDTAQIAVDAVTGTQLAAGSVGTTELEGDAVTNAKIADNAVDTAEIAAGAVTNAKIATGAVMSASLGSDAVTSVKIINAAVTSAKLATDIPISTFSDVNTTGVNNGQILTYNGTTWVPTNNSGGGNTDNSRLGITLDPSSLNEADEATSITVTLAIVNPISDETISGQSVTVTDPTGHSVAVSGSGNSFTFMASTANNGNFVVRASATFTTGGTSTVHSSSANLPVIPTPADNINWYQAVTATVPTTVSGMDDQGVYNSPEKSTLERTAADEFAYVALPGTTPNAYTFHAGLLFATITDLGVFDTSYRLYQIDDFAQVPIGQDRIITITEA